MGAISSDDQLEHLLKGPDGCDCTFILECCRGAVAMKRI